MSQVGILRSAGYSSILFPEFIVQAYSKRQDTALHTHDYQKCINDDELQSQDVAFNKTDYKNKCDTSRVDLKVDRPNDHVTEILPNKHNRKNKESCSERYTPEIELEKNIPYVQKNQVLHNKDNSKENVPHSKINSIPHYDEKSILPNEDNSKENVSDSKIEINPHYDEKILLDEDYYKKKESDLQIDIIPNQDEKHSPPSEDNDKENESDSKMIIIPICHEKRIHPNEDNYEENESDSSHHTTGIESEKNLQDDNEKNTLPNKINYKDGESHLKCSTSQEVKVPRKKRSWKKSKKNLVVSILRKSSKYDDEKDSSEGFSSDFGPNVMNHSKKNERGKKNRSVRFCRKVETYEFEKTESVQENFPSDEKLKKKNSSMDVINDEIKIVPKKSNFRDWKFFKVCGRLFRKKEITDSTEPEIFEDAVTDKKSWKKVKNNFNALKGNFSKHLRNGNKDESNTSSTYRKYSELNYPPLFQGSKI